VLLATAAVIVTGCGTGTQPLRHVTDAVRRTLALPWVRYELTVARPRLFAPSVAVLGGRGAYELPAGLGYEFLALPRPGRAQQLLFFDFRPEEFLLAPPPATPAVLPAGKAWISVPFTGAAAARGALAAQIEALSAELPLDEVSWGARAASPLGARVVGHEPMDEYRVSVDVAAALSAARRARRASIAAAIEAELHSGAPERLTIDVWVNGPGYVGRIEAATPGSGLGRTAFLFTSFTEPYSGTAPPSSQIVPLDSVARAGRSLWAIAAGS
jgi:hypothetical protein